MSNDLIDITDVLSKIPKYLYRGDQSNRVCSNSGTSLMVNSYQSLGLFTNMICNGNPLAINRDGIRASVSNHILGWKDSHYLSFTEDLNIAERFAIGRSGKRLFIPTTINWDAVVFEFKTAQFNWSVKGVGVYMGVKINHPNLPPYFHGQTKVALVDCVTLLRSLGPAANFEMNLALSDKEWLLIPLDPMNPSTPNSHVGYSANIQPGLVNGTHYDLK